MANMLEIGVDVKFPTKGYRSFLRKLMTLFSYTGTVGIHSTEAQKKVSRTYLKNYSSGYSRMLQSGTTSRMTVGKLAYQNEFSADIPIKIKYKAKTRTDKFVYNMPRYRVTTRIKRKFSTEAGAGHQGYLLMRNGEFIAYWRPGKKIHIPKRPFISTTVTDLDEKTRLKIMVDVNVMFVKGQRVKPNFEHICKLLQFRMQRNVRRYEGVNPRNHWITIKAKGFNGPLVDTNGILYKSIKYKIYKNIHIPGSRAQEAFLSQMRPRLNKLLASASQYEKMVPKILSNTTKTFNYVGVNPNYTGRGYF